MEIWVDLCSQDDLVLDGADEDVDDNHDGEW